jgi:exodeoxyribonuclease III
VLTLEFDDFYLLSAYVPNAGEGLKRLSYRVKEWDLAFIEFINTLKKKKNVIVSGDLNVAHEEIDIYEPKKLTKSPGFTPEERKGFSDFLKHGYVDSFRHLYPKEVKYSFFSKRMGDKMMRENKGWRLDYFVIDNEGVKRVENSEILQDYTASDHCPIKLTWA